MTAGNELLLLSSGSGNPLLFLALSVGHNALEPSGRDPTPSTQTRKHTPITCYSYLLPNIGPSKLNET